MTIKRIRMSSTKGKETSIRDLVQYIHDPKKHGPERILYSGSRGFLAESLVAQQAEMIALASESIRSKSPVYHYVLSWREGEQPTGAQIEEAVDILAAELGLVGHQMLFTMHGDTDNIHAHVLVNRVHPLTNKIVDINNRFDLEAAHKAIARIELAQGWQREKKARYTILENGELGREHREQKSISQKAHDLERRQGEKSAERVAIEEAKPIIERAGSWKELHAELGKAGMRYVKKGSGAIIMIGETPVKASAAGRECSLKKVEERLGEFLPAETLPAEREPEAMPGMPPEWRDFQKLKAEAEEKAAELRRKHQAQRRQLEAQQKAERETLLERNWKGRGELLNAMRKQIAEKHRNENAELEKAQRAEMETLEKPPQDFETYLKAYLKGNNMNKTAEEIRYIAPPELPQTTHPPPPPPESKMEAFARYSEAVGADRYRVTCIKMLPDGSKKVLILDKKGGESKGWTPEEVKKHLGEMERLEKRGENIYLTPLSDAQHHILIDDMTKEKAKKLVEDGFKPAVILESSPGNFQAILTLPKLGSEHDRAIGNRLAERLNKTYGDPKLSGAIHPHRAPGFANCKPKHQRKDGSFPLVRIVSAVKTICRKTLELAKAIQAELAAIIPAKPTASPTVTVSPGTPAAGAYYAHLADIIKRIPAQDFSRLDAMIAVRMRATGHGQAAIRSTIEQCAPTIRPKKESRNWKDYAQRTAAYAFSLAGDQQLRKLSKYKAAWMRLEAQNQINPPPPKKSKRYSNDTMSQKKITKNEASENEYLDVLKAFCEPPLPLNWVWPGFLGGSVGALVAPGGSGKSYFALQAAIAVASNEADLLELHPSISGKVLYYAAEDPKQILEHRLHSIGKHLPPQTRNMVAQNLLIKTVLGTRFNIISRTQEIIEEGQDCQLIILDTLSRVHTLNENDNSEMAQLISILEYIATKTGAAILFLHHITKTSAREGIDDQHSARGASSLIDNSRYCANLTKLTNKEASLLKVPEEKTQFYLRFKLTKQNYHPPIENRFYKRGEGGILFPVYPIAISDFLNIQNEKEIEKIKEQIEFKERVKKMRETGDFSLLKDDDW